MDAHVVQELVDHGLDVQLEHNFPVVPIQVDEVGTLIPAADTVVVMDDDRTVDVTLRKISDLFVGDRRPPMFSAHPPPEYLPFFLLIERAAADYCACTGEQVRDKEFEEIYDHLRRRPDGNTDDPLLLHVRATIRLYMSLRDVSRSEYEGVLRRLARSARTFAMGYTSTNYRDMALLPLLDD